MEYCHDPLSSFVLIQVLSRHFVFYFEILSSLSFQVSCPSSCVKCLIVFPDSKVFPPVPHGSTCIQIVCVSLVLCQCVVTILVRVLHPSPALYSIALNSMSLRLSVPSYRVVFVFLRLIVIVSIKFHSLFGFLRYWVIFCLLLKFHSTSVKGAFAVLSYCKVS